MNLNSYRKLFLGIAIVISTCTYSQNPKLKLDSLAKNNIISPQVNVPDKLNIIFPPEYFVKQNTFFKDYLPAILTLIAGLLAVYINWKISAKLRENTKENIERQLAEARSIKIAEIKSSINIKNRQEWMNQFREAISEYVSLVSIHAAKMDSKGLDYREEAKKLAALSIRVNLLLHPEREFEDEALIQIDKLFQLTFAEQNANTDIANHVKAVKESNDILIGTSRKILEKNWQKMNAVLNQD